MGISLNTTSALRFAGKNSVEDAGVEKETSRLAPATRHYFSVNKAIRANDVPQVDRLVKKGLHKKFENPAAKERRWLFTAARIGHGKVVGYLMSHFGIDANTIEQKSGMSLLMYAAKHGDTELTNHLIQKGADINLQGGKTSYLPRAGYSLVWRHNQLTALSHAILNGHAETALALVKANADVNIADDLGTTPFLHAALTGQVEVMKELVANGADPAAVNDDGITALMMAAAGGHVDALKYLLNDLGLGAHPEAGLSVVNDGELIRPARLLDDFSKFKRHMRQNALMLTVANGNSDAMKFLVQHMKANADSVGIDLESTDGMGWPVLLYAAKSKRLDMVDYLLENGANPAAQSMFGDSLLTAAARNGWTDLVKRLVAAKEESGIDINADDRIGFTALMHAVWGRHHEMRDFLLAHGAELRPADKKGKAYLAQYDSYLPFLGPRKNYIIRYAGPKLFSKKEKPGDEEKPEGWFGKRWFIKLTSLRGDNEN